MYMTCDSFHLLHISACLQIKCKHVVLAAGAWSKMIVEKIGINLPIRVIKHNYVVTDIIPGMSKFPNVRYNDGSVYLKVIYFM